MKTQRTKKANSILYLLREELIIYILLFILPVGILCSYLVYTINRYDSLIENIAYANELRLLVSQELSSEVSGIMSGRIRLENGKQNAIVSDIENHLDELEHSEPGGSVIDSIRAARRAVNTLRKYISQLEMRIRNGDAYFNQAQTRREITGISEMIDRTIQEYSSSEIEQAGSLKRSFRSGIIALFAAILCFIFAALLFNVDRHLKINEKIADSIGNLDQFAGEIAHGNLDAKPEEGGVEEFRSLNNSLAIMAGDIKDLLRKNTEEQRKQQKLEMRALQAQITPHFLYNTFDTIVWLAEQGMMTEVIDVTMAFTSFFRISLSKGHDWIPVSKEEEHIKSYLLIQKYRYQGQLEYDVDVDPMIYDEEMLKLVLQPIVENAIYHGTSKENRRIRICVTGRRNGPGELIFTVSDDGIGMSPEMLSQLKDQIRKGGPPQKGYGLFNVGRRLELYYGRGCLEIESTEGVGTIVMVALPVRHDV